MTSPNNEKKPYPYLHDLQAPYTIDEIISSIAGKPVRTGFSEVPNDTVHPIRYLNILLGSTEIRTATTLVPISMLRILQPAVELWRYLRLCTLSHDKFNELTLRMPLDVVRGRTIEGYPLLLGNHRALYALMHGITELPATIHILSDETAAERFAQSCLIQYQNMDQLFGRHDVVSLREAYKDLHSSLVHLHSREKLETPTKAWFRIRSKRYAELSQQNKIISDQIPCISLDGYVKSIHKIFKIPLASILISEESVFYRQLLMTQPSVEKEKLKRIKSNKKILDAPILLFRTRMLDYVVAGHTRLRARLDADIPKTNAIVIHVDNDSLNGFLDTQAAQSGYLIGNAGIRRLSLI